jgi:hypothetical protein
MNKTNNIRVNTSNTLNECSLIFVRYCVNTNSNKHTLKQLSSTAIKRLPAVVRKLYETAIILNKKRQGNNTTALWPTRTHILIPLADEDGTLALALAQRSNSRRKNWESSKPGFATTVLGINHGRYSCRCTFTRWGYIPVLKSHALVSRWGGKAVLYEHYYGQYLLRAPRGWRWNCDANGLRLISRASPKDDFHPNSFDLRLGIKHILRCAVQLRLQRLAETRKARKEKQLLLKHAHDVRVGLKDSHDAGNCDVGSTAFAQRYGLDLNRYYSPAILLKLEPNNERLKLAIAIAVRRHARFVSAGAEVFYP